MRARPRTVIACLFALSCAVALGAAVSLRDSLRAAYLVVRIDLSRDLDAQRDWLTELLVLSPSAALPRVVRWVQSEFDEWRRSLSPGSMRGDWEPWESTATLVVPSGHTEASVRGLAAAVDAASFPEAAAGLVALMELRERFPRAERTLARHLRSNPDLRIRRTASSLLDVGGICSADTVTVLLHAILGPDPEPDPVVVDDLTQCVMRILGPPIEPTELRSVAIRELEARIDSIVLSLGQPSGGTRSVDELLGEVIGESSVVRDAVVAASWSSEWERRVWAAAILADLATSGEEGAPARDEALAALMELEGDPDYDVRTVVYHALRAIERSRRKRILADRAGADTGRPNPFR